MDGVEIVMEVEDAFDIRIEDAEAEKLLTPGELIDLVMNKVATASTDTCLTHRAFNLLRRFVVNRCELERRQVRVDTALNSVFPLVQRQTRLQQLSADLAIASPPELVRPEWLKALVVGAAALAGIATAIACVPFKVPAFAAAYPAMFAAGVTAYIGVTATKRLRKEFPKGLTTVGELARWIMMHKADLASPETTAWTRAQVASRVRDIVVATLSCESSYREDARFVQDLGLS